MAKGRKRRRSSSPQKKKMRDKTNKRDDIVCFQGVWKDCCSASLVNDEDKDAEISNVFFELANAPFVSYRLKVPPSPLSSHTNSDNAKTISSGKLFSDIEKETPLSKTIVIQQDVLGAAQNHTGGIVWETSYLLLNYLLATREWLGTLPTGSNSAARMDQTNAPKTVLEIGAGCGMLGLSLHRAFELGILNNNKDIENEETNTTPIPTSRVVITETNEVMANLRSNFERNHPQPPKDDTEKSQAQHQLSVEELDWTRYREDSAKANIKAHSVDCIVGTDVVFSTRFVLPMLETMRFLSHPQTVIYLCLQERCKDSHHLLLKEAIHYGFLVEDISETVYQDERLADSCGFGRALECKLLRFTVMAVANPDRKERKKSKKEKKKKSK